MRRSISTPSSSDSVRRRRGEPVRPDADRAQKGGDRAAQQHHTTTVTYTGDNNVTYNKTCEPNRSDISPRRFAGVSPEVRHTTDLQEDTYPYLSILRSGSVQSDRRGRSIGASTVTLSGVDEPYTYCRTLQGNLLRQSPSKDRTALRQEPVIILGVRSAERFALKTKYFYDEQNPQGVPRGVRGDAPPEKRDGEQATGREECGRRRFWQLCPARGWQHHLSLYSNM